MGFGVQERRERRRYRLTLPVGIASCDRRVEGDTGHKERVGLSCDVSASGILFNTRSKLMPGDQLELRLHLSSKEERPVKATVVRVENVPTGSNFLWRYLAAVKFESAIPDLERALEASAQAMRGTQPEAE